MKLLAAALLMLMALPAMADEVTDNVSFAWTSCEDTKKCVVVNYGCDQSIAINALHVAEAKQLIDQKGLNPRKLKCTAMTPRPARAACVEDTCTLQ